MVREQQSKDKGFARIRTWVKWQILHEFLVPLATLTLFEESECWNYWLYAMQSLCRQGYLNPTEYKTNDSNPKVPSYSAYRESTV